MKLVFDIESNGLLDKISTIYCLVAQDIDTKEIYEFSDYDTSLPSLANGLDLLDRATVLIGHNIIGYDIPAIKIVTGVDLLEKKCMDTFIMSQTLRYRRNHKHGLKGWGEHLGDYKIDYNDWSGYSKEMLEYCIQDVKLNTHVYEVLMKEYAQLHNLNPLIREGLRVEHEVARFNVQVRNEGWKFDLDKANATLERMSKRMEQIEAVIHPKMGTRKVYIDKEPKTPKFKKDGTYNSHTVKALSDYYGHEVKAEDTHLMAPGTEFRRSRVEQITLGQTDLVKEFLLKEGWKPDEYTKKNVDGRWINVSPKLTSTSLSKLGEIGELIDEYYTIRSRKSVLEGWIEKVRDGRLHGNMWTIGTPSFRARHEVIVNLPSVNAAWGQEIRELLIADDGWVVVGADSSGNQLRGLCHYVGDPEYTDVVVNGDQHQRNADALGCTRPGAKSFLYAYLFGAGDAKLGQVLTGKANKAVGAKAKEDFAKSIKGMKELKESLESAWKQREVRQGVGWIFGLDGRPLFVPSDYQCLNYLLQCTEGITCKAAVAYCMQKIKEESLRAKPRLFYHDEVAYTAHPDDAKRVGEILQESFREAPKWFGVNCMNGGDYCIGDSYAAVH